MKLLFISTNDHVPWGGSEELWSRAAVLAVTQGHQVLASVKEWTPRHDKVGALAASGVQLHERYRRPLTKGRFKKTTEMFTKGWVRETEDNWNELFSLAAFDHVTISLGNHLDSSFCWFAEQLKARGIPYTVIVQLVHPYATLSDEHAERLILAYSHARHVVFVSTQNLDIAALQLGHAFRNASVISNPVDMIVADGPLAYPSMDGGFRLAMVCGLVPFHKGHDIVVSVMAQEKWKERALSIDLFGTGSGRRIIERNLADLGIRNMKLCGFESDKQVIWRNHHAALFASRMEGRSLALLEAMASGRMVVSTDVGGARELIDDGHTGFIVPHAEASSLDEVLERAWNARSQWQEMGSMAFARFRKLHVADPVHELLGLISS